MALATSRHAGPGAGRPTAGRAATGWVQYQWQTDTGQLRTGVVGKRAWWAPAGLPTARAWRSRPGCGAGWWPAGPRAAPARPAAAAVAGKSRREVQEQAMSRLQAGDDRAADAARPGLRRSASCAARRASPPSGRQGCWAARHSRQLERQCIGQQLPGMLRRSIAEQGRRACLRLASSSWAVPRWRSRKPPRGRNAGGGDLVVAEYSRPGTLSLGCMPVARSRVVQAEILQGDAGHLGLAADDIELSPRAGRRREDVALDEVHRALGLLVALVADGDGLQRPSGRHPSSRRLAGESVAGSGGRPLRSSAIDASLSLSQVRSR